MDSTARLEALGARLRPAAEGRHRDPDPGPAAAAPDRAACKSVREAHVCGGPSPGRDGAAAITYRRTERAALVIETTDGDTVYLRISSRTAASARAAERGDHERVVTELTIRGRSATRIAIAIDGELDAAELEAVRNVVTQAAELAETFFTSGAADAFEAAAALAMDPAELARVSLRMSTRERAVYSAPAPTLRAAAPGLESPASEPRAAASGDARSAPAASPPAARASEPAPAPRAPAEAEPRAAEALPSAAAVLRTIASFLSQLLDALDPPEPEPGLATITPADLPEHSIDVSLKLEIFRWVVLAVAAAPAESVAEEADGAALHAPQMLGAALDELAASGEALSAIA